MKSFFILYLLLFSAVYFAQTPNWTGVKETNINVSNAYWLHDGVDIFTNRYGNHIIVQEYNSLKYYRMNITGYSDPESFPIIIENSFVVSPSITGDEDNLYIVYGIGSQMRIRRSTNGGSSWSLFQTYSLTVDASSMESYVSNENLHITYLESSVVKYRYFKYQNSTWHGAFTVSTGETGTDPRITARYGGVNNDYVYFTWQKQGTHVVNWRKFEVTSSAWDPKQSGYEIWKPNLLSSYFIGFNVTGSTIVFYYYYSTDEIEKESTARKFEWLWKDLNNNYLGTSAPDEYHWHRNKIYSTTTVDNKSHAVYYLQETGSNLFAIWRSNSTTGYPADVVYDYDDNSNPPYWEDGPRYINNSSAGNEVHVIWKDEFGNNNGNNLRYKWDNQNPIAPSNLDWSNTGSPSYHPIISWEPVNEPDVRENSQAGILIERRFFNSLWGVWGNWSLVADTTGEASSWIDKSITNASGAGPGKVAYRLRAKDIGNNISPYSETIEIVFGTSPEKMNLGRGSFNYTLNQNFPNPFNPATKISYSIKEDGFVSLKIYDNLGREVKTLISENQSAGIYDVNFDASDLPSGMYIYTLRSNEYVQTKKMILLK